jgi:FtsH-binding integral membrane protein
MTTARLQWECKREDVMKAAFTTLIATAAMMTTAFTANGALVSGPGILCWACLGFCAAILVGQTIPAALIVIGAKELRIPPSAANH